MMDWKINFIKRQIPCEESKYSAITERRNGSWTIETLMGDMQLVMDS